MKILAFIGLLILSVMTHPVQAMAARDVNNFRISSYDISYVLSKDDQQRSVLETTEMITAEFPLYDQNHGLERSLPASYDGHPIKLKVTSITDEKGESIPYTVNNSNGMKVLRIGDGGEYVRGKHTYRIAYAQHDVTRFFDDNNRDEWYWDTNGTAWQVPIEALTVTARFEKGTVSSRVGEPSCYQGVAGSTNLCMLMGNNETGYTVKAANLKPGENITMAYGFNKGTFASYEPSTADIFMSVWKISLLVTSFLGLVAVVILSIIFSRRQNRSKELHTIVTEYIPPKGVSVLAASQVVNVLSSAFSAQLIDFAVRHYIEIIETKAKSVWKAAEYDIKIITDPSSLLEEEKEILIDMFGVLPKVGDRLRLSTLQNDMKYFSRTKDNDKKLRHLVEGAYALREKVPAVSKFFYKWSIGLLIFGIVTLSPVLLVIAGVAAIQGFVVRPLTDKGLELRRYVLGLDKYIKAAEAERLKLLQGPDTAQKIGEAVDISNPGQLVKLYERALPYAILFGREKDWAKRLGEFYETADTRPDWYSGNAAFSAVVFSSSLANFSTTAAYSGGSSSTSGSTGGGASGGGGGGGGGGGW